MRQIGILVVSMAWHGMPRAFCVPLCPLLCSGLLWAVCIPILRLAATKRAASVTAERWTDGLPVTKLTVLHSSSPNTGRSVRGAVGGAVVPLRLASGVWGAQGSRYFVL
jgi:hypothetical protein